MGKPDKEQQRRCRISWLRRKISMAVFDNTDAELKDLSIDEAVMALTQEASGLLDLQWKAKQ